MISGDIQCWETCGDNYFEISMDCDSFGMFMWEEGYISDEQYEAYGAVIDELSCDLCFDCDSTCNTCSDETSSTCMSCYDGAYLHYDEWTGDNTCESCDPACETCDDDVTCDTCVDGDILYDDFCYTTCPDGTYQDDINCVVCDASCATCDGGSDEDCLTCASGTWYDVNACVACDQANCLECSDDGATSCIECDPYYMDDGNGACVACDVSCYTCTVAADANACASCSDDQFLSDTNTCSSCNAACVECDGDLATECTSCVAGEYVVYGVDDNGDAVTYGTCTACNAACYECSGGDLDTDCSACATGYAYQDSTGACVADCTGSWNEAVTCDDVVDGKSCDECAACSLSCTECTGETAADCAADTCTDGYYYDDVSGCLDCSYNCATCTGPEVEDCVTCDDYYPIITSDGSIICWDECDEAEFVDYDTLTCTACDSMCYVCEGPAATDCYWCVDGYDFMRDDYTCYDGCPNGYFAADGLDYNEDGECVTMDPSDDYYAPYGCSECFECDASCTTCSAGTASDCLSCGDTEYLEVGVCVDACADGRYADSSDCLSCDATCSTCTGGTSDDCASCPDSAYTYGSTCVDACPSGTEAVSGACETVEEEEGDGGSAIRNLVGAMLYMLIVLILV